MIPLTFRAVRKCLTRSAGVGAPRRAASPLPRRSSGRSPRTSAHSPERLGRREHDDHMPRALERLDCIAAGDGHGHDDRADVLLLERGDRGLHRRSGRAPVVHEDGAPRHVHRRASAAARLRRHRSRSARTTPESGSSHPKGYGISRSSHQYVRPVDGPMPPAALIAQSSATPSAANAKPQSKTGCAEGPELCGERRGAGTAPGRCICRFAIAASESRWAGVRLALASYAPRSIASPSRCGRAPSGRAQRARRSRRASARRADAWSRRA